MSADNESSQTQQGEYIYQGEVEDDPAQLLDNLLASATRYMEENPKKTAVIVTATLAAAMVAAVTAVAAATVVILADDVKNRLLHGD